MTSPSNQQPQITITVSGLLWFKAKYLANQHQVEVGGWCIAPDKDKPFEVHDFKLTKQESTVGSIDFDDEGTVEFMEDELEAGLEFDQFMRVWIHTHPGDSASPSPLDRTTFRQLADTLPYVVMLIISKSGSATAEIGYKLPTGQFVSMPCGIRIDWAMDRWTEWDIEFNNNVTVPPPRHYPIQHYGGYHGSNEEYWKRGDYGWYQERPGHWSYDRKRDKRLTQQDDEKEASPGKARKMTKAEKRRARKAKQRSSSNSNVVTHGKLVDFDNLSEQEWRALRQQENVQ